MKLLLNYSLNIVFRQHCWVHLSGNITKLSHVSLFLTFALHSKKENSSEIDQKAGITKTFIDITLNTLESQRKQVGF